MSNDYNAIKAEIDADPLTRGYSGMTDQQVADSMNAVDRVVNKTSMTGAEISDEFDSAEYTAMSDVDEQKILSLAGIGSVDPFGFASKVIVKAFGGGSATVTALQAARVETVSRAAELGLSFVSGENVRIARAL